MDARVAEAALAEAQARETTLTSWRRERGDPSLSDVHRSIAVAASGPTWRKVTAFLQSGSGTE